MLFNLTAAKPVYPQGSGVRRSTDAGRRMKPDLDSRQRWPLAVAGSVSLAIQLILDTVWEHNLVRYVSQSHSRQGDG